MKVFDEPFEVNLIVQDEQMTFLLVADWESKNHAIIFIFTKLLPAFKYFLVAHIASSLERTYKRSFDKAVITAFNARTRVYLLLCKKPATTDETDKIFSHKSDPNKDLFEQFVEKFKKVGSNSRQNVKIITLEYSEVMCCYNLDHSLQPSTQTRKNVSELFKTIQPMAEKNRIAFFDICSTIIMAHRFPKKMDNFRPSFHEIRIPVLSFLVDFLSQVFIRSDGEFADRMKTRLLVMSLLKNENLKDWEILLMGKKASHADCITFVFETFIFLQLLARFDDPLNEKVASTLQRIFSKEIAEESSHLQGMCKVVSSNID